jgi:cytochrome d ubiquinol oxidase subunit I
VTGVLRTADAASPVPAGSVITSLALFIIVYGIIFSAGIVYINRTLDRGPAVAEPMEEISETGVGRPISAARREEQGA